MAKYGKGILGSFTGAVGNVVGATWNGIPYMRSKPAQVNDRNSEKQRAQRQRFQMIMGFLRKVRPVIDLGFARGAANQTSINRASSYNLRNAITGEYPDQQIDFTRLLVARGDLTPPEQTSAESTAAGEVTFTWADNSDSGSAQTDDTAMVLVYSPEKEEAVFRVDETAERQDGSYTLTLPSGLYGEAVECYLAFVSTDNGMATDSVHLGSVEVTEE